MGHLVDLYYPEAAGGTFVVTSHGASGSNPSVYTDYDCTNATIARSISSTGRAFCYVKENVDVAIKNASGTTVATRTYGVRAEAVQLQSPSFTGTGANGGQEIGGKLALDSALDYLYTSFGARDGKVRETGTNVDLHLKDALQNVRSNNTNVFNVKQPPYNAVGDGVTVDDDAVQAAHAALVANGGGILYFPSGTYLLTRTLALGGASVVVEGEVSTGGLGGGARIKSSNATNVVTFSDGTGQVRANFRNIGIETTSNTAGLLHASGGHFASDVNISDCVFLGPSGGNSKVVHAANGVIRDCIFLTNVTGTQGRLELNSTFSRATVTGCVFASSLAGGAGAGCDIAITGAPGGAVLHSIIGNRFQSGTAFTPDKIRYSADGMGSLAVVGNEISAAGLVGNSLIRVASGFGVCIKEAGNTVGGTSSLTHLIRWDGASTSTDVASLSTSSTNYHRGTGASTSPIVGVGMTFATANANYTINAPQDCSLNAIGVNVWQGAECALQLHNGTAGAITVTLNATYHGTTGVNLAAGTTRVYRWRYSTAGTVSGWIQQGAVQDVT